MVWRSSVSVTLLECALRKNAPATPLECAVTKLLDLKSRGISSYKKCGGWGYQCGGWRAFDSAGRKGESKSEARGAEVCWVRKLPGVGTTRSQSRTCTSTVSPALSLRISDSGGKRSGGVLPVLFAWRKLTGRAKSGTPLGCWPARVRST